MPKRKKKYALRDRAKTAAVKLYRASVADDIKATDGGGMFAHVPALLEKANKLPDRPGVYYMRAAVRKNGDKRGDIIYVGKAKNLKNRVTSYFRAVYSHNVKTFKLVSNIRDFDFYVTSTELDALVLEAQQIKLHNPKYNILLKDDKGFNYIRVSDGGYPKITYEHQTDKAGEYIGPYAGGFSVKQLVEEVNTVFKLPLCRKIFPKDIGRERPCLNYNIGKCMGVCTGKFPEADYAAIIAQAREYIKNGAKDGITRLETEMFAAAERLDFEKAAILRDRLNAIKRVRERQNVLSGKTTDYDVIASAQSVKLAAIAVVKYRGGRVADKQTVFLGDEYNHTDMVADFLSAFYVTATSGLVTGVPREIYIDCELDDKGVYEEFLHCKIITPKRGELLTQVTLAKANASEYLALRTGKTAKAINTLESLTKTLGLPKTPEYIECYDISNLGDTNIVAGMCVWKDGRPFKAGYRKFKIKSTATADDYASMREVITRRLSYLVESSPSDTDNYFYIKPDLIFVDGGHGQLSVAMSAAKFVGVTDIPMFGLVKDNKHRTRGVAVADGGEILLSTVKDVFAFLTDIQDETHRYAITFQKSRRKADTLKLALTDISGIGEKKATALLTKYKTKAAILAATAEEIANTIRVGVDTAREVQACLE
ncbi:MAG: excinuclease ABC subunit UvrC [Oscillospiraceae bacterium]|jgi:excinuclease ABC subunit C|nr:excinuclease ABC subunit UvrC [Oscillospiraceae bacterium]